MGIASRSGLRSSPGAVAGRSGGAVVPRNLDVHVAILARRGGRAQHAQYGAPKVKAFAVAILARRGGRAQLLDVIGMIGPEPSLRSSPGAVAGRSGS